MADAPTPARLSERYRTFALAEGSGSPLYHDLAAAIALLTLTTECRGPHRPGPPSAARRARVTSGPNPDGVWDEAASVLGLVVHHGDGTVTSGALARLHAHLEWIVWAPVSAIAQSLGAR